jgi:hypothetical protein
MKPNVVFYDHAHPEEKKSKAVSSSSLHRTRAQRGEGKNRRNSPEKSQGKELLLLSPNVGEKDLSIDSSYSLRPPGNFHFTIVEPESDEG